MRKYEIVRVLEAGGFGITYLGYDHHLNRAVAVTEYLPNDLAVRKGPLAWWPSRAGTARTMIGVWSGFWKKRGCWRGSSIRNRRLVILIAVAT